MPERQEITASRVCRDAHPKNTNMLMVSMLAVIQEQKEQRRIDSSKSRKSSAEENHPRAERAAHKRFN